MGILKKHTLCTIMTVHTLRTITPYTPLCTIRPCTLKEYLYFSHAHIPLAENMEKQQLSEKPRQQLVRASWIETKRSSSREREYKEQNIKSQVAVKSNRPPIEINFLIYRIYQTVVGCKVEINWCLQQKIRTSDILPRKISYRRLFRTWSFKNLYLYIFLIHFLNIFLFRFSDLP
jgi:hypothetical protein